MKPKEIICPFCGQKLSMNEEGELKFPVPDDCNMVIICVNTIQAQPRYLCLPHQVTIEKLRELIKEPGVRNDAVSIMPCDSDNWIHIPRSFIEEATDGK